MARGGPLGDIKRYCFPEDVRCRNAERTREKSWRREVKRGRDESNFRAKRSRVHGKNIIRGMALSFSRDNATEKVWDDGGEGRKGEDTSYRGAWSVRSRPREDPYPDLENTKSLSRSRVSPSALERDCDPCLSRSYKIFLPTRLFLSFN